MHLPECPLEDYAALRLVLASHNNNEIIDNRFKNCSSLSNSSPSQSFMQGQHGVGAVARAGEERRECGNSLALALNYMAHVIGFFGTAFSHAATPYQGDLAVSGNFLLLHGFMYFCANINRKAVLASYRTLTDASAEHVMNTAGQLRQYGSHVCFRKQN